MCLRFDTNVSERGGGRGSSRKGRLISSVFTVVEIVLFRYNPERCKLEYNSVLVSSVEGQASEGQLVI